MDREIKPLAGRALPADLNDPKAESESSGEESEEEEVNRHQAHERRRGHSMRDRLEESDSKPKKRPTEAQLRALARGREKRSKQAQKRTEQQLKDMLGIDDLESVRALLKSGALKKVQSPVVTEPVQQVTSEGVIETQVQAPKQDSTEEKLSKMFGSLQEFMEEQRGRWKQKASKEEEQRQRESQKKLQQVQSFVNALQTPRSGQTYNAGWNVGNSRRQAAGRRFKGFY